MTTETLYVKSLPAPWLDNEEKTYLKRAWRFLRTNKKSLFDGTAEMARAANSPVFRQSDKGFETVR